MEFAWIIERKAYSTQIEYGYFSNETYSWTANSHTAIRYSRKEDADRVIDALKLVGAYPAEHGWEQCASSPFQQKHSKSS
jgi:hypothetical protein